MNMSIFQFELINYLYFDNWKVYYNILKSTILIQNKSCIITLHGHSPVNMELIQRLNKSQTTH